MVGGRAGRLRADGEVWEVEVGGTGIVLTKRIVFNR